MLHVFKIEKTCVHIIAVNVILEKYKLSQKVERVKEDWVCWKDVHVKNTLNFEYVWNDIWT